MKVSVVNSAGSSFCWNYATDTFHDNYVGENLGCIYASFKVVLSVTGMLMDLSVVITQVNVSVQIMQFSQVHIWKIPPQPPKNCYKRFLN